MLKWLRKEKAAAPPAAVEADGREIAVEASVCTGERLVGFKNRETGRLEEAVVVRGTGDIAAFYRSHGRTPPGEV